MDQITVEFQVGNSKKKAIDALWVEVTFLMDQITAELQIQKYKNTKIQIQRKKYIHALWVEVRFLMV